MDAYEERPDKKSHAQYQMLDWVIGNIDESPIDGMEEVVSPLDEDEVRKALEHLEKSLQTLPEFSVFGDNNHQRVRSEIEILQWVLEK
jgi:hypothetical protein